MDAKVVDFPDPVGPVTMTMPLFFFAKSVTIFGSPSSSEEGTSKGNRLMANATLPRCRYTFALNLPRPGTPNEKSAFSWDLKIVSCVLGRICAAIAAVSSGVKI